MVVYERPERPTDGSPEQLLNHAVRYGTYCQKLETQVSGWLAWYKKAQHD
ncbi:phage associated protein [Kingella kingae ATCC 23330]|uniref:Phage associated protein n=1 Tax=Kingella kingae ATCC 23330 TaxID=887327 RepID=F5S4A2_KINKI|nr:phage associated protein [Kingella kingae ATCC 23330]